MSKIAIGIGVVLAISIVLVIVIGYLLPVRHVSARVISLRRGPDETFALITDVQNAATWRTGLRKVELLPANDGLTRFREASDDGTITYEIVDLKPPTRMVTRISDPKLPFGGYWIYEISSMPEGCRLNITERGEIYNPVFRFVSRFFLGYHRSLDKYLESVGRKFREAVQPSEGTQADAVVR
jgi:hypothetical protein